MWLFGLIGILRGRAELKIKHANWVALGFLFCFFGIILSIISVSIDADTSNSAGTGGMWLDMVAFLLTFIGIFAFIYNIFPKKWKKIIAIIFCIAFVGGILNSLIAQPKVETMVDELDDYIEEGEVVIFELRREPTYEEILNKYDELKRPLIPFKIIEFLLEMSIVIVLLATYAIFNKAKRGWGGTNKPYRYKKYEYEDEEDEEDEEEDDEEELNVLERLRRKQQRQLEKTNNSDPKKSKDENPQKLAKKESIKNQKKCIKCGHSMIPADSQFCAICGTDQTKTDGHEPVTHTSRCINCGVEMVQSDGTFCHNCGASQKVEVSLEATKLFNKCIDCGVAIEPPLVFCTICVAKQRYEPPAESPNPLPIGPSGGQYVHQQQIPNIPLAPQRYGQQDLSSIEHFIPREGGGAQVGTAGLPTHERPRTSPAQYDLQKLVIRPPTIDNSSPLPKPITPPSAPGLPLPRMVSIVCSKCNKNYGGQIVSIPSVVDCPFCGTPKIFDSG